MFMGSDAPTQEDFDRTPMLVRKKKVVDGLEWLKLNHEGYADLEISKENLDTYPDKDIPVVVDFRKTDPNSNRFLLVHWLCMRTRKNTEPRKGAVHLLYTD
jgi:hypothetical protein